MAATPGNCEGSDEDHRLHNGPVGSTVTINQMSALLGVDLSVPAVPEVLCESGRLRASIALDRQSIHVGDLIVPLPEAAVQMETDREHAFRDACFTGDTEWLILLTHGDIVLALHLSSRQWAQLQLPKDSRNLLASRHWLVAVLRSTHVACLVLVPGDGVAPAEIFLMEDIYFPADEGSVETVSFSPNEAFMAVVVFRAGEAQAQLYRIDRDQVDGFPFTARYHCALSTPDSIGRAHNTIEWDAAETHLVWLVHCRARLYEVNTGRCVRYWSYDWPLSPAAGSLLDALQDTRPNDGANGCFLRALPPGVAWVVWPTATTLVTCALDGTHVIWERTPCGSIVRSFHESAGTEPEQLERVWHVDEQYSVSAAAVTEEVVVRMWSAPDPVLRVPAYCPNSILDNGVLLCVDLCGTQVYRCDLTRKAYHFFPISKAGGAKLFELGNDLWAVMQNQVTGRMSSRCVLTILSGTSEVAQLQLSEAPLNVFYVVGRLVLIYATRLEWHTLDHTRKIHAVPLSVPGGYWHLHSNRKILLQFAPRRVRVYDVTEQAECGEVALLFEYRESELRVCDAGENVVIWAMDVGHRRIHVLNLESRRVVDVMGLRVPHDPERIRISTVAVSPSPDHELAVGYSDGVVQIMQEAEWNPFAPCVCDLCRKHFNSRRALERHLRSCRRRKRCRMSAQAHPLQCRHCGQMFTQYGSARRHERKWCDKATQGERRDTKDL